MSEQRIEDVSRCDQPDTEFPIGDLIVNAPINAPIPENDNQNIAAEFPQLPPTLPQNITGAVNSPNPSVTVCDTEATAGYRINQTNTRLVCPLKLDIRTRNGIRQKYDGKNWRRLCDVNECSTYSRKGGRCIKHYNEVNAPSTSKSAGNEEEIPVSEIPIMMDLSSEMEFPTSVLSNHETLNSQMIDSVIFPQDNHELIGILQGDFDGHIQETLNGIFIGNFKQITEGKIIKEFPTAYLQGSFDGKYTGEFLECSEDERGVNGKFRGEFEGKFIGNIMELLLEENVLMEQAVMLPVEEHSANINVLHDIQLARFPTLTTLQSMMDNI